MEGAVVDPGQEQQVLVGSPGVRVFENPAVVQGVEQAFWLTKAGIASSVAHSITRGSAGLRRQTLAALGTATVQDMTTTLGGHAGAETVGALALEYAGLESSFHGFRSKVIVGCRGCRSREATRKTTGRQKRWAILVKSPP